MFQAMIAQKDYWNEAADKKEFTTPFQFDRFFSHVRHDARILDYGCGYGRTLFELKKRACPNLYGVDFSEKMIKRALSNDPDIHFSIVNSGEIPFPDDSFDSVLLLAVLTCVYRGQEQDSILQEIRRVMKPDGVIYINDFLLNGDDRNVARYEKYNEKYSTYGVFELPDGAVLRHHSEERVDEWIRPFETLAYEKTNYVTMNGHRSNGVMYLGRLKK